MNREPWYVRSPWVVRLERVLRDNKASQRVRGDAIAEVAAAFGEPIARADAGPSAPSLPSPSAAALRRHREAYELADLVIDDQRYKSLGLGVQVRSRTHRQEKLHLAASLHGSQLNREGFKVTPNRVASEYWRKEADRYARVVAFVVCVLAYSPTDNLENLVGRIDPLFGRRVDQRPNQLLSGDEFQTGMRCAFLHAVDPGAWASTRQSDQRKRYGVVEVGLELDDHGRVRDQSADGEPSSPFRSVAPPVEFSSGRWQHIKASIPIATRRVVVLRALGFNATEIAARENLTLNAVGVRLSHYRRITAKKGTIYPRGSADAARAAIAHAANSCTFAPTGAGRRIQSGRVIAQTWSSDPAATRTGLLATRAVQPMLCDRLGRRDWDKSLYKILTTEVGYFQALPTSTPIFSSRPSDTGKGAS